MHTHVNTGTPHLRTSAGARRTIIGRGEQFTPTEHELRKFPGKFQPLNGSMARQPARRSRNGASAGTASAGPVAAATTSPRLTAGERQKLEPYRIGIGSSPWFQIPGVGRVQGGRNALKALETPEARAAIAKAGASGQDNG